MANEQIKDLTKIIRNLSKINWGISREVCTISHLPLGFGNEYIVVKTKTKEMDEIYYRIINETLKIV